MPPDKLFFTDWNRDRFLAWAEKAGHHTHLVIKAILDRAVIEQQAYRSCFGVLSLKDKYGAGRLERACGMLLSRTPSPSYQQLKGILEKDLDAAEPKKPQEPTDIKPKRGFQRGAGYFGGDGHA